MGGLIERLFRKRPKPQPPVPQPPAPDAPQPPAGSGLVLRCADTSVRPAIPVGWRPPTEVGPFQFPAPYATRGWRLTAFGERVRYVGYSYWPNINRHLADREMRIFVSLEGSGPELITVDKGTGVVARHGPIFNRDYTGEGMYWSRDHEAMLYYVEGRQLRRRSVHTKADGKADGVVVDLSAHMHGDALHQCHTAGMRHCGTVMEGGRSIGSFAFLEDRGEWRFFEPHQPLDECQLDKSGRWLIIKEGHDNRIIDLDTGSERFIANDEGAVGHSDTGTGFVLGEDDYHSLPGAAVAWGLAPGDPWQRTLMYHTTDWQSGMGHLSLPESRLAWLSNASNHSTPRANEIVWFYVDEKQQTSPHCVVAAPNLVDPHKVNWVDGNDRYKHSPKGNCDVSGEYFIWTANAGEDGLSAWMVQR